jgi:hypothetical protein
VSRDELREAHRVVEEGLILLAAPEADRVRGLVADAVAQLDAEAVRREGHMWSGQSGLNLLRLADRIETVAAQKGE